MKRAASSIFAVQGLCVGARSRLPASSAKPKFNRSCFAVSYTLFVRAWMGMAKVSAGLNMACTRSAGLVGEGFRGGAGGGSWGTGAACNTSDTKSDSPPRKFMPIEYRVFTSRAADDIPLPARRAVPCLAKPPGHSAKEYLEIAQAVYPRLGSSRPKD